MEKKFAIGQKQFVYTNETTQVQKTGSNNYYLLKAANVKKDSFTIENKSEIRKEFEEIKNQQGIIGKAWDGFKNLFGMKSGSKKVEEIIKKAEKGEINQEQAKEAIEKYKEGQKTSVDVVADVASGILSVLAFTLAVPTGGASLAIGLGLATAVGAGIKVGVKATDALTTGKEYKGKDLLYDTTTGAINGLLGPITNGIGNTVTATIGKQITKTVVKEGAEEVAEQAVKQGIKQTAKNVILNQTVNLTGGTAAQKALAMGAGMAVDGALGGASDNMVRAGLNGENVLKAGVEGAIGGAIMAPIIGGGFNLAGKAGHAINNKITTKIVLPDGIKTKFKQGSIGDCALLSTIDGMMNNPKTAKTFKKSITKTIGGDYNVKIGDQIVRVSKNSLSDEVLSDKTGIRIFEQAYKQLTGDIDGGFAEVVAKQFGLNPVHITQDSITDELLDNLAKNQGDTVLSFGTIVDTDGAIAAEGQRHYFTIKNIDAESKTVTLTSPVDTSKTIELSYDEVKSAGISIDGGSVKELDLPSSTRAVDDTKFKGTEEHDPEVHTFGDDGWGEEGANIREDIRTRIFMNACLEDNSLQVRDITIKPTEVKTKYTAVVETLSQLKNKQGGAIYEYMIPTADGKGIRCKTVLAGRNKQGIEFKLRKLQENGIGTIIDLRAEGECSSPARKAIEKLGLNYVNFPVEDGNWTRESLTQLANYIKAVNTDNYCVGCANGQARTDLAIAINYIFNPKATEIPTLYYGTQSSSRVSIKENINQILSVISENPEIITELGYKNNEEFSKSVQSKFTKLIKQIK